MTTDLLPDGSRLKPGEVIYQMTRPLHVNAMNLRSGPVQTLEVGRDYVKRAIRLAIADEIRQTAPQRQRPNLEGARDYQDAFSGDPKPDAHSNGVDYVSVASMARCEPKLDFTKASSLVRNGTVKPDKVLNGRGHFTAGKSAQTAFSKLKSLAVLKK